MAKKRRNYGKKGGQFEREFCKRLSLWWTRNERDDCFWRSSNSGGRATTRAWANKQTHGQAGDVAATHPDGEALLRVMTFELKRGYPKSSIHDVIDRPKTSTIPQWLSFWKQAELSAKRNKSFSYCLVTRRDRREAMIWLPDRLCTALRYEAGVPDPPIRFRLAKKFVYGELLDSWLKRVSPEDIKDVESECCKN